MTRELRVYATRGRADDFRMCLGSLYRRNAASEIRAIVRAVAAVLPDLSLHLFGIKLGRGRYKYAIVFVFLADD